MHLLPYSSGIPKSKGAGVAVSPLEVPKENVSLLSSFWRLLHPLVYGFLTPALAYKDACDYLGPPRHPGQSSFHGICSLVLSVWLFLPHRVIQSHAWETGM